MYKCDDNWNIKNMNYSFPDIKGKALRHVENSLKCIALSPKMEKLRDSYIVYQKAMSHFSIHWLFLMVLKNAFVCIRKKQQVLRKCQDHRVRQR